MPFFLMNRKRISGNETENGCALGIESIQKKLVKGLFSTIENIRPSALRRLQNGRLEIEIELRPAISALKLGSNDGSRNSRIGTIDTPRRCSID